MGISHTSFRAPSPFFLLSKHTLGLGSVAGPPGLPSNRGNEGTGKTPAAPRPPSPLPKCPSQAQRSLASGHAGLSTKWGTAEVGLPRSHAHSLHPILGSTCPRSSCIDSCSYTLSITRWPTSHL